MSHVDATRGLRWVKSLHGHMKPPMLDVIIPASTTIYTGGFVVVSNAGVIAFCGAAGTLGANNLILGVAPGYLVSQATATHFQVINPINQIFEIQLGNSTTAMDTMAELYTAIQAGTRYAFLGGNAGVSGLNISAMEVDLATTGTTANQHVFQVVGFPDRPDNAMEATTGDLKGHVRIADASIAAAIAP